MVPKDEFERIVESVPELAAMSAYAPDGFIVLLAVDGTSTRLARIDFMEKLNAVCEGLKDPSQEVGAVVSGTHQLDLLARRVVLESGWQEFKDWYLNECPVFLLSALATRLSRFVLTYRAMCGGAPAYSGESFYE